MHWATLGVVSTSSASGPDRYIVCSSGLPSTSSTSSASICHTEWATHTPYGTYIDARIHTIAANVGPSAIMSGHIARQRGPGGSFVYANDMPKRNLVRYPLEIKRCLERLYLYRRKYCVGKGKKLSSNFWRRKLLLIIYGEKIFAKTTFLLRNFWGETWDSEHLIWW